MDEPCLGCETIAAWNTRPSPWIKIVEGDESTLPKEKEIYLVKVHTRYELAMYNPDSDTFSMVRGGAVGITVYPSEWMSIPKGKE
jgi:hypothetical protein